MIDEKGSSFVLACSRRSLVGNGVKQKGERTERREQARIIPLLHLIYVFL